ncbi:MAG: M48 family metalloprotease, partial [Deltaproteobacteria bacterium]
MAENARDDLTSRAAPAAQRSGRGGGHASCATPRGYQAMKNRLFLFRLLLEAGFLTLFLSAGWSRGLKRMLLPVRDDFFFINALYFAAFSLIFWVLFLPFDIFEGYVWEHRNGLGRGPLRAWCVDHLKKSGLSFAVALVLVEGVYYLLSVFPRTWWLGAAGLWFGVSVLISRVFPRLVLPLFYKVAPLGPGALRDRLRAFLYEKRVGVDDIFVLDFSRKTGKANAMVAGWGRAKRIFLSDTLVRDFPPEEVEAVLAHEVAHARYGDTWLL